MARIDELRAEKRRRELIAERDRRAAEPSFGEKALGGLEATAAVASGIVAEPLAGLLGITAAANPFLEEGAGGRIVEEARKTFTFQPRTEEGKANIQAIGEFVKPAGEALEASEEFLGDTAFETTGSPALAAAATAIPTALLELAGAGIAKGITKLKSGRALEKALEESTPSIDELKNASRQVFTEIDELGIKVQPKALDELTKKIESSARKIGASPRTTPQVFAVIDDFKEVVSSGAAITLSELDELRTVAGNAAKTIDPSQKAPAIAIIDQIDSFLDESGSGLFNQPKGSPNIGKEYRAARNMWGRARKSELIEEALEAAERTASGLENGIRIEFRKILNSKKKSRFLSAAEKAAMNTVVDGAKGANLAKALGRLGFSEGASINIVNPLLAGGLASAAIGSPLGFAVTGIGQVSKKLAQILTKNNAKFADTVIRSGSNAEQITKAYVRNTTKGRRSASELAELLIRNDVDLNTARSALAKDAADLARQGRAAAQGALVAGSLKPEDER